MEAVIGLADRNIVSGVRIPTQPQLLIYKNRIMNKVEIRVLTECIMVWVKDGADKMIESIKFISDKQVKEICRDFDAYISIDERTED